MIPIDLPPKIWMPPKPAIIRAWKREELSAEHRGLIVIGGLRASALWTYNTATQTNQSTFTATGVPFSTASARRHIIITFRCGNLTGNFNAPTSCTIGGVSATKAFQFPTGTSLTHYQIWIAAVPTGTSGTISIVRAADMNGQILNVWAGYNLRSATPVEAAENFTDPTSVTLDVSGGGFAIGYVDNNNTGPYAWSGLTEDVDTSLDTIDYSAATVNQTQSGTLAVGANGAANHRLIAASFR